MISIMKDVIFFMGKPCAEYRAAARNALRGNYWYAFGLCLLVTLAGGITSGVAGLVQAMTNNADPAQVSRSIMVGVELAAAVSIAYAIFVLVPMSVGLLRYFILSARGRSADVNELGYVFKNGLMNVAGTKVKKGIFIYLWTLLLVVPGIIKSYSYLMIDYMLAENPNMPSSRAFEISKAAMDGYKGKAFLLELSFIGWVLLCLLTAGIGFLFLDPYIQAAQTQLYFDIKESAFARGIIQEGELPR